MKNELSEFIYPVNIIQFEREWKIVEKLKLNYEVVAENDFLCELKNKKGLNFLFFTHKFPNLTMKK